MQFDWPIFKRIAAGKLEKVKTFFAKAPVRIDQNLPLGLRFTAPVEIPETDFILAGSDNLKIAYPKGYGTVTAYGTFPFGDSTGHRFYLTFDDGQVFILQVMVGKEGKVEECKLYAPFDEVFPADADGWAFWLNEQDGYIGYSIFDTKLGGPRYVRAWENTGPEMVVGEEAGQKITRIPPVQFQETIYLDENGRSVEQVDYTAMLYGRWVSEEDGIAEYLLVSAAEDREGAAVRIMVGLEIRPNDLKIL
jgi:hypothetical protein